MTDNYDGYWEFRYKASIENEYACPVINGIAYFIGNENSKSSFRGYDGQPFYITFDDGTMIRTTNLWHNGTVPETYKDRLPDNAHWSDSLELQKSPIHIMEGTNLVCIGGRA